jgi:hypothetical protein
VHSINAIRQLMPEAYKEAVKKYPNDVEGALIFYTYAIGLCCDEPSLEEIEEAKIIIRQHNDLKTNKEVE